jgi:hypothetical protein
MQIMLKYNNKEYNSFINNSITLYIIEWRIH